MSPPASGYVPKMSTYSDDQSQPADSLVDRGVDDVLDEGMSPPEREFHRRDGTLEDRLRQEEPEPTVDPDEEEPENVMGPEVGDERAGRLVAPDEGAHEDQDQEMFASDVGVDGAGASAEEAAMHVTEDFDGFSEPPDE